MLARCNTAQEYTHRYAVQSHPPQRNALTSLSKARSIQSRHRKRSRDKALRLLVPRFGLADGFDDGLGRPDVDQAGGGLVEDQAVDAEERAWPAVGNNVADRERVGDVVFAPVGRDGGLKLRDRRVGALEGGVDALGALFDRRRRCGGDLPWLRGRRSLVGCAGAEDAGEDGESDGLGVHVCVVVGRKDFGKRAVAL